MITSNLNIALKKRMSANEHPQRFKCEQQALHDFSITKTDGSS